MELTDGSGLMPVVFFGADPLTRVSSNTASRPDVLSSLADVFTGCHFTFWRARAEAPFPSSQDGLVYSVPGAVKGATAGSGEGHPRRRGPLWKVALEGKGGSASELDDVQSGDQLKVADVGGPDAVGKLQSARPDQQIR